MRAQEMKIKAQDKLFNEIEEDIGLKNRSLETVIQERNDERDANIELQILNQTLTEQLATALKKLEDAAVQFNEVQNKSLVLESEKTRLLESAKAADLKVDRLTKSFKELRSSLMEMQKAKVRVEEQLVKLFKKLGMANQKMKPTDVVNKHRPNSGARKKVGDGELKRNRSREEISQYEEIEDFLDFGRKKKLKAAGKEEVKKPKRLQLSDDEDQGMDYEDESPRIRKQRRGQDVDSSPRSFAPSDPSTPGRARHLNKADTQATGGRIVRAKLIRPDDSTPRSTISNSNSIQSEAKSTMPSSKKPSPARALTDTSGSPKHKLPTSHHKATGGAESPSKYRNTKSVHYPNPDENPWAPEIRAVEENIYEENEGQTRIYTARSIESITTNSSEEGLIERTVINEHGEVISVFDKKLDTRHFSVINARAYSKSVQFDFEDPEIEYDQDGTATTKDGQARFYLPFNPNVVFGLKGDVFYHTLFQVFQARSKVQDGSAVYIPPYKLEETKVEPPKVKPPSIKRSPKKVPHTDACGEHCKHLTKHVKPKVRDDMVLTLKKLELVI